MILLVVLSLLCFLVFLKIQWLAPSSFAGVSWIQWPWPVNKIETCICDLENIIFCSDYGLAWPVKILKAGVQILLFFVGLFDICKYCSGLARLSLLKLISFCVGELLLLVPCDFQRRLPLFISASIEKFEHPDWLRLKTCNLVPFNCKLEVSINSNKIEKKLQQSSSLTSVHWLLTWGVERKEIELVVRDIAREGAYLLKQEICV
ncbi:hypothetical protein SUGI_0591830 [Cryptomeria japonica]|nr:hypothetical protein SUGI_0591830 [Cryptomeria japonica]